MKNRKTKNTIFFVVGFLVAFARLNTTALPLFNSDGSEEFKQLIEEKK
ncbi:MAG: hypothetical protein LBS22_01055 [Puniceicoccales bacterium]|nr:hypothetical protein [Puniceicoccales bacterium]